MRMFDGAHVNFRTLDLNLLRVFDEVMAERSLTRAARNLAMTQPAVSNALRRLRDSLDDALVVRAGYGVEPTPFALTVWPAVREALGSLRSALGPSNFDPSTAEVAFVVSMADTSAAQLMPPLIRRIEAQAPKVSLRVLPLTTRDPRKMLEDGQLDAVIGYFPAVMAEITLRGMQDGSPAAFGTQRLYEGRYVCVMRRDHPLTWQSLTLDAYCEAHHLLVSFTGRPFGFIDEALEAIKRSRRIVLTVNQFFTAGQVVRNSDLLTVLPEHFVSATGFEKELAIRPMPLEVPRFHVDLLWHRRHQHDPGHQWLRAGLVEAAQEIVVRR
jgi:DNA-binding transcriptional LysR family regulator